MLGGDEYCGAVGAGWLGSSDAARASETSISSCVRFFDWRKAMRFSTGALATDGSWRTMAYQHRFFVMECCNSQDTADVMRSSRTMLATCCAVPPSCAAVKDRRMTESRETMTESWRRELRASALPQSALVLCLTCRGTYFQLRLCYASTR